MADESVDETHEPHADIAALHDQPGQNEERHGKQNVIAGAVDHGLGEHHERAVGRPKIGRGCKEKDEANGDTGKDRHEEQRECDRKRRIASERRQPHIACERNNRDDPRGDDHNHGCRSPGFTAKILGCMQCEERHCEWKRQRDQRRGRLEDWRALAPARGNELGGGDANQRGHQEDNEMRKHQARLRRGLRHEIERNANECVLATTIGDRAADKREHRK